VGKENIAKGANFVADVATSAADSTVGGIKAVGSGIASAADTTVGGIKAAGSSIVDTGVGFAKATG
jgi:hypothetical protein